MRTSSSMEPANNFLWKGPKPFKVGDGSTLFFFSSQALSPYNRYRCPGAGVHLVTSRCSRRQVQVHPWWWMGSHCVAFLSVAICCTFHQDLSICLYSSSTCWEQDDLEADPVVRGRPIVLQSKDCHALWVSSKALEVSLPFPESVEGGVIVRNSSGFPTGCALNSLVLIMSLLTLAKGCYLIMHRSW